MEYTAVLVLALTASCKARGDKRQSGPVDPATDPDCRYYDTALSSSDNCGHFESYWGVFHANFVGWNPSIKDACSGIEIGNAYCVEVTHKPSSTVNPSAFTCATPTGLPKPLPTQESLIDTCTSFYKAIKDDTCDKIIGKYGTFSNAQFYNWNPAVEIDCSGLQNNVHWYKHDLI